MYITTISLSYVFLAMGIISLLFFSYFKFILVNSHKNSDNSKKIIGNMKNQKNWETKNNILSYICLFWAILSITIFIYLKFYYTASLLSIVYLFVYIAFIALTLFMVLTVKEKVK
ncbi:hypothetical protein [Haloimpatiens massiliensis]|uniref:hypothetical protein n=1 Tax=Haloimpatiens massiliensis TaxID=1658110 RepID=UPI000C81A07B|nr:hypothetical protein [Haloimpatiens massiliensis]